MALMLPAPRSLEEFVRSNAGDLVGFAYLITWNETDAEDLVQECLFVVAKRWHRVAEMDLPLAYTRRVLVNLALDGRQKRSRRRRELSGDVEILGRIQDATADAAFELVGARQELVEALGVLPRRQRTVLGLRYFLDLSEAQTAAVLGCSVGVVKSNASRGLARLRELAGSAATPSEVKRS
jgi:RNA polymerase sigma-70 factor (sigma-E family)